MPRPREIRGREEFRPGEWSSLSAKAEQKGVLLIKHPHDSPGSLFLGKAVETGTFVELLEHSGIVDDVLGLGAHGHWRWTVEPLIRIQTMGLL